MTYDKARPHMNALFDWLLKGLMIFFVVMVMVLITAVMSLSFDVVLELSDASHKSPQTGVLK